MKTTDTGLAEYLDFAKELAIQAGDIMLEHFKVGVSSEEKAHAGDTPVTLADKAINQLVIETINGRFPEHAVIGEEASYVQESAEFSWVCDPIDGTIPFVMGMPTNVFSLALVGEAGQPLIAVVYDPYLRRMYTATKNGGASMNGEPIKVNATSDLSEALIGGTSRRSTVLKAIDYKAALMAACYRPIILSSLAYEAMLVASGQIAATVFTGADCHDAVCAKLIIDEAGGKVTDVFGNEQRYDRPIQGAIISNGHLHTTLVDLATQYKL